MERLQKVMAARGLASRREAEKLIAEGRVKVDGVVVSALGSKVDAGADIQVDSGPGGPKPKRWVALHKPVGVVSTKSSAEGKSVMDLLPPGLKDLNPVGRFDKDSSGLILLSDDGVLGYAIVDPTTHLEKEYEVRTLEAVAESQLEKFRKGVRLDGELLKGAPSRRLGEKAFRVTLTQGLNRQIRRMCQKVGLGVAALRRVRIGPLSLGSLKSGEWRPLREAEVEVLRTTIAGGRP